jgi:FtsH-binding integral membrane protein
MITRFVAPGIVFLLTLASGLWLSRAGKPLNPILFNIHKLIALAAVVIAGIRVYNVLKGGPAQAVLTALLIFAGLSVVALFVTGALMSMNKPAYRVLLTIHNVAPFVAVIAAALVIYSL